MRRNRRTVRSRRWADRSEEHTSELQSLRHLVCRLHHRDLHSFPTRRSSDLHIDQPSAQPRDQPGAQCAVIGERSGAVDGRIDRKSTRLNSSHLGISYAVFTTEIYTLSLHDALPIFILTNPVPNPETSPAPNAP